MLSVLDTGSGGIPPKFSPWRGRTQLIGVALKGTKSKSTAPLSQRGGAHPPWLSGRGGGEVFDTGVNPHLHWRSLNQILLANFVVQKAG